MSSVLMPRCAMKWSISAERMYIVNAGAREVMVARRKAETLLRATDACLIDFLVSGLAENAPQAENDSYGASVSGEKHCDIQRGT